MLGDDMTCPKEHLELEKGAAEALSPEKPRW